MRQSVSVRCFLTAALLILAAPVAAQSVSVLKDHDVSQPIEWEADRSELLGRDDVALFLGNVRVTQGGLSMFSDRLHVFYSFVEGSSDPVVERLDATGAVRLESESETASAEWGVYDVNARIITLGGSVELVRGETRLSGERLAIDLRSGITRLDGGAPGTGDSRIKGKFTLPPTGSEGPGAGAGDGGD